MENIIEYFNKETHVDEWVEKGQGGGVFGFEAKPGREGFLGREKFERGGSLRFDIHSESHQNMQLYTSILRVCNLHGCGISTCVLLSFPATMLPPL